MSYDQHEQIAGAIYRASRNILAALAPPIPDWYRRHRAISDPPPALIPFPPLNLGGQSFRFSPSSLEPDYDELEQWTARHELSGAQSKAINIHRIQCSEIALQNLDLLAEYESRTEAAWRVRWAKMVESELC